MKLTNKIFILLVVFLFSTFLVVVEAKEEKTKGDEFKEPKNIKTLSSKGETIFMDGDWVGARKYFYQYLG